MPVVERRGDRRPRQSVPPWCAWLLAALIPFAVPPSRAADEPQIPPPRGFVNDFAGVLDAGATRRLEQLIEELEAKTGAEIAVVTVESTQPLSAFDYAMKIAESWKPGAKGKDNGVVFLTAVRDRELFILTGYGIEGALPDGRVGEIRDRQIVPRFRQGDYAGGIRVGTEALAAIIAQEYGVTLTGLPPPPKRRPPARIGIVGLLVLLLVLYLFMRSQGWQHMGGNPRFRRRGHWGGGFGGGGFGGHGGGFGGSGGGFGGFGGGGFGGGGAGGRW